MKVFITSASGFIGSAVTRELLTHGHTVLALARSESSAAKATALGASVIRGDMTDLAAIRAGAASADATVHTAFDYSLTDMSRAVAAEVAVIDTVGAVYEGTGKTLVISGESLIVSDLGRQATEDDAGTPLNPRLASEVRAQDWSRKGVHTAVIRLAPLVHGPGLEVGGFIRHIIAAARRAGFAATVGGGENVWPAAYENDIATLYRLAIEVETPGFSRWHGTDDEVRLKDIARIVADTLGVEVKDIPPAEAEEHFGSIGTLVALDNPISNEKTQGELGWVPAGSGLLQEMRRGAYFDGE